jgi:hypothetical protein
MHTALFEEQLGTDEFIINNVKRPYSEISGAHSRDGDIDSALATHLMKWKTDESGTTWMDTRTGAATAYCAGYTAGNITLRTLWQPTKNADQSMLCVDALRNTSRTRSEPPRTAVFPLITYDHITFFNAGYTRIMYRARYSQVLRNFSRMLAFGVLCCNALIIAAHAEGKDDQFFTPQCFLEVLHEQCANTVTGRIEKNAEFEKEAFRIHLTWTKPADVPLLPQCFEPVLAITNDAKRASEPEDQSRKRIKQDEEWFLGFQWKTPFRSSGQCVAWGGPPDLRLPL